jgi:predicted O-methyltransferase YrrM
MLSWEACDKIDGTFDFVFIDGDHSLDGIRRDWADWSKKVQREGIIALHDTNIPPNESDRSKLGSHKYFQSVIQHDERFRIVEQVDSLSILQRKAQE